MNLVQINAALSDKKCWQITRRTLRVDARCRNKELLQRYADELYDRYQAMHDDFVRAPGQYVHLGNDHHKALHAVMFPLILAVSQSGYRDMADALGVKINTKTLDAIAADADERASFSAGVMGQTTVERIRTGLAVSRKKTDDDVDIDDDLHDLEPVKDYVQNAITELAESYVFSQDRAKAATDFEGLRGYRTGVETGAKESGQKLMKIWVIDPEVHDRTDDCDEAEADGPIPVGEAFSTGDMQPPSHPNCSCALYYTRN